MKALIVGIDSVVGRSVAQALRENGDSVIATSRRTEKNDQDILPFDLSLPQKQWPDWPEDIEVAFIAAAMSRQKDCEDQPEKAHFINVEQTLKLIDVLLEQDIHVVYPSTNLVLACNTPNQPPEAPLRPKGTYGHSKAEVEKALKGKEDISVVRLPKILDGTSGLLGDWKQKLESGEHIRVFTDIKVAPVSLKYAANFIVNIMQGKQAGIWQISGEEEISYAVLAQKLAAHLGMESKAESLLQEQKAPAALGGVPLHPGMDCAKTKEYLGLGEQALPALLKDCFGKKGETRA